MFHIVEIHPVLRALPEMPKRAKCARPWRIAGLITALMTAGLRMEAMRKVPAGSRQPFEAMVRDPDREGCWRLSGDPPPLSFALPASKRGWS